MKSLREIPHCSVSEVRSMRSDLGYSLWKYLKVMIRNKQERALPGTEEEEGNGGALSDVGRPGGGDRATQDDTVGVVDLAELIGRESYTHMVRDHHKFKSGLDLGPSHSLDLLKKKQPRRSFHQNLL